MKKVPHHLQGSKNMTSKVQKEPQGPIWNVYFDLVNGNSADLPNLHTFLDLQNVPLFCTFLDLHNIHWIVLHKT